MTNCNKCNDKGFYASERYFCVLEMCSCKSAQKMKNADGSISVDMRETPEWFQRNYEIFTAPDEEF